MVDAVNAEVGFDFQPTLQGELVDVRPLTQDDYRGLYQIARDPLIWEQHPAHNRHEPEAFRAYFDDNLESGGALTVLRAGTEEIIGATRYHNFDPALSEIEIGWTFLSRAYWGGRYNGELKDLTLRHAFRFVRHVVFLIGPGNIRSQRSVEKRGAVRSGTRVKGGEEMVLYVITGPISDETGA